MTGMCCWSGGIPPTPLVRGHPTPSPTGLALGARVATWGDPPSSVPWMRDLGARGLVRVSPSLSWLCAVSARCYLGGLLPSFIF